MRRWPEPQPGLEAEIRPAREDEWPQIAALAARSLVASRLQRELHGFAPATLVTGVEEVTRAQLDGHAWPGLVLQRGAELLGAVVYNRPGDCPSSEERLAAVRRALTQLPPHTAAGIRDWANAWSSHEPVEPHYHLRLLVVHESKLGLGNGERLMRRFLRDVDRDNATAVVEVETMRAASFAAGAGFELIAETPVLSVPTWLLRRPPRIAGVAARL